ncbi:hypothetical protein GI584_19645 [Gracilibacillus salitolerans]|uniref:F5/8 type C domain-containing protein n=2 Tax=Gracilibacillus salitolerans TaxID=2663022 RepID=A0A5Q2TME6_9BACI|nr:hypothetical protein GI584_19645 [Gracilibacillus salitolerans]
MFIQYIIGSDKMRKHVTYILPVFILFLFGMVSVLISEASVQANASGTDYYVDATNGIDSNDGQSPENAWKTFTPVNNKTFKPGDRILLKAGEIWEDQQLWPKGSGAEGAPIIIDMYGDESLGKPYIAVNGNVPTPVYLEGNTWKKDMDLVGKTGAVILMNQQYWEIHNLEISNDDDFEEDIDVPGTERQVVRDGISISINADLFEDGEDTIMDYFRITNNEIHDIDGVTTWQRIHYGGINFQVFGDKPYTEYADNENYFKDVKIEHNNIINTELHAIQFGFNWFNDLGNWEQDWIREKDIFSRDVYIGHNYAEDIGQGAIQLANTKDMLVEYNEVNGFLKRYDSVSAGLYSWASENVTQQFNEVYDGVSAFYDGTPFDFEFSGKDIVYQYNYTHDNPAGWMSYMGRAENNIARYNLSVNDNGVLIKNQLHVNWSPAYFVNNTFVYDGAEMEIHDEEIKSSMYLYNNIFYNYNETTPTTWARRVSDGKPGIHNMVFQNNAIYEASGLRGEHEPVDLFKITDDPQFVGDPTNYTNGLYEGTQNYKLKETSPLINAGRYVEQAGTKDYFGNPLYRDGGLDIGIHEVQIGEHTAPEDYEVYDYQPQLSYAREENLLLDLNERNITVSHENTNQNINHLVDGDLDTRWQTANVNPSEEDPIRITFDLGEKKTYGRFVINQQEARIGDYYLDYSTDGDNWTTVKSGTLANMRDYTLDFDNVEGRYFRLNVTSRRAPYDLAFNDVSLYDRTPIEPSLEKNILHYDKDALDRHTSTYVFLEPNGNQFENISHHGEPLVEGEDYILNAVRVDFTREYLDSLSVGEQRFDIEFTVDGNLMSVPFSVVISDDPVSVITELEQIIDSYSPNEIKNPMSKNLLNRLNNAEKFLQDGKQEQAIEQLTSAQTHLNKPSLSEFITNEAKDRINELLNMLESSLQKK